MTFVTDDEAEAFRGVVREIHTLSTHVLRREEDLALAQLDAVRTALETMQETRRSARKRRTRIHSYAVKHVAR